jgi:hypothetical protein
MRCSFAGRLRFLRGAPPFNVGPFTGGAPSVLLAYGEAAAQKLLDFSKKRPGVFYRNSIIAEAA